MFNLRSIRTRIALTILTASTAALLVMALAIFITFRTALIENFNDTLRAASTTDLSLVDSEAAPPTLRPAPTVGVAPSEDEAFVRLYSPAGLLLVDGQTSSHSAADLEVERQLVNRVADGSDHFANVWINSARFRELAVPVEREGQVVAILLTGIRPVSVDESLTLLRAILLVVVPLTGVLLAIAAFVIARQALQPVSSITATARGISGGDLHQRIQGVTSQDEVGELAATFNMMIERLQETFERERRFTGDASHELRTPLTAMETALEVTLSQERSGEEYRDALRTLQSRTGHLTRMARQLLILSRLDADAVKPTFATIDLGGLLAAIIAAFEDDHPEARIASGPVPHEAIIRGDPELLARAFTNVLENSRIHAGPAVPIAVEVTVAGAWVTISVHDSGPGISTELLPTVFERFRRNESAKTAGGAGLGLAIVQSIVRLHGGSVMARNDEGAVFVFQLPLESEHVQSGASAQGA